MKYQTKHSPYDGQAILKNLNLPKNAKKIVLSIGTLSLLGTMVLSISSSISIPRMILEVPKIVEIEKTNIEKDITPIISVETLNLAKEESQRVLEERKLIKLYSDIYSLDSQIVYQTLSELTDHFKDQNYVENHIIGDSMVKGHFIACETKEKAILIAVRTIAQNPEKFGLKYSDLVIDNKYQSDMDYSHQIAYISNVVGVDPALNYAICRAECGFNSPMFLKKNNPSGLRFSNEYATFPSTMAGFIEQALELLKHQLSGRTTIEQIGNIHANVKYDPINASWVSNVKGAYYEAIKDYEILFGSEELDKDRKYF